VRRANSSGESATSMRFQILDFRLQIGFQIERGILI
jgi:hypothetical protein